MNSNARLIFGTEGDLLLYIGPGIPAIFVPYSMVRPLDGITYHLPAAEVITGQTSLLILGALLPRVRDIRALENLPKAIPPGTAAFKLKQHGRCTYAYINSPAAAGLDEWASRNRIHCLITPVSCKFTSLARQQSWFRSCALTQKWERLHAKLGVQQLALPDDGTDGDPFDLPPSEDAPE